MNRKQYFIQTIRLRYLVPQEKRWKRIIDSASAVICFSSGLIGLYLLQTQPGAKLPGVSTIVVWGYIIASIPIIHLLYRESDLRKIERLVLVLFILLSSMSLLFSVMSAYL